jgi:hypothetical protein
VYTADVFLLAAIDFVKQAHVTYFLIFKLPFCSTWKVIVGASMWLAHSLSMEN